MWVVLCCQVTINHLMRRQGVAGVGEEIRVTEDRGPKKHVGDDMKNTTNEH